MSSVSFDFSGKLVLVTGSTGGIGFAVTQRYLEAGASVFVNGRSDASVERAMGRLEEAVPGSGDRVHALVCDLSVGSAVADAIEAVRAVGPLDVLVNNAGKFWVCKFAEVPDDDWTSVWETNVMSGVRLARAFLPEMLERDNGGNIVFVSSECGLRPIPDMIPYSVSKAAQISLARGLAELTKGTTVRVNSVLPGPTMTEGVREFLNQVRDKRVEELGPDASPEAVAELTQERVAKEYFSVNEPTSLIARFLDVQEIAATVLFVTSDAASGINGVAQKVEGGVIRAM